LRVNKGIIQGDDLSINVIGASSLPFKDKGPDSFNSSFEVRVPLSLLSQIPELARRPWAAFFIPPAPLRCRRAFTAGTETSATTQYPRRVQVRQRLAELRADRSTPDPFGRVLKYAGGEVRSQGVHIDLKDRFPIVGELTTRDVRLEGVLDSVKSHNNPIRLPLSGDVKAEGFLAKPLAINLNVRQQTKDFLVLKNDAKGTEESNVILHVPEAKAEGTLIFSKEKMSFQAELTGLEGKMSADGYVGFDDSAKIRARSDALSLSMLRKSRTSKSAARPQSSPRFDIADAEAKIAGSFDVTSAEVASLPSASEGQAFFQNNLLSFENLEMAALEPVRGSGFVDFKPKETHYKFNVDARRVAVDEAFAIFDKKKVSFTLRSPARSSRAGCRSRADTTTKMSR